MLKIKNYIKNIGFYLISIISVSFIITLINYITSFSTKTIGNLCIIASCIIISIISLKEGRKSAKKGVLIGLINGLIIISSIFIISLIFFSKDLKFTTLIYYGILILSSIFGAIIGKNKRVS